VNQTCQCGEPTSGAWLCDKCTLTFRWSIVNVSAHYHDLGNVERKQVRYGGSATKGSIGKAQPLPVDMRFTSTTDAGSQLKYDVWATVVAWCRTVMEDQPQPSGPMCLTCIHVSCAAIRRRRWPHNTITSMVNYLARQFSHITSQQWAPSMFDEFLDLERRLTRMVDSPPERWYAGRCGVPDLLTAAVLRGEPVTCETELYATAERGTITCQGCGIQHDVAERRDFLLLEAREYHVTATEAAAALLAWTDYDGTATKLVDRIRKWRDRDRLDVADVTSLHGRDRHLYRLGDIQDLLIGDAQTAQTKAVDRGAA
jgi:hypothetical protein